MTGAEKRGDAAGKGAADRAPTRPAEPRPAANSTRARKAEAKPPPGPKTREVEAWEYQVALPQFEGPLDLLLHLIQEHELNILDIPIGFITERYLAYLAVMRELTIDVASEYLVMAATLAYIKSKMLLPEPPKDEADGDGDEALDPREELVRRLLEYQKYKAAALDLGTRANDGGELFPRGESEPAPMGPAPFAELGVFSLLDAFEKLLTKTKGKVEHQVVFDRITITDRINELVDRLRGRRNVPFEDALLDGAGAAQGAISRFDLVITFLAVLEMCKLRMLRVYQSEALSPIYLELLVSEADTDASAGDPAAESPGEEALSRDAEAGYEAPAPGDEP